MKKFCLILLSFVLLGGALFPVTYAGEEVSEEEEKEMVGEWEFDTKSPADLVKQVYTKANDEYGNKVQNTKLDSVSSSRCTEIYTDRNFTLARTLCNIKSRMGSYLQYITYIGIAAAIIFLIRNGFKLVTSSEKEKQMSAFKKNILYLILGISLLIAFNYIIDIFVSVVTLVLE